MDLSELGDINRQSGKEVPDVPIKTYKWEDIRRARRRGGYPWTYLYKEEFGECIDPEDFKMDGLRKNKTSSASSASDSLEIREITEDDVKGLEGIDSSYVVIEGPILLGGQIDEPIKDQEVVIESAESSDNISQYLDKEDRDPDREMESTETLTVPGRQLSESVPAEEKTLQRAKSEEPKRKRKLSIESNYSRISLSKLGVMKRLREAKEKLKLPKLGKSPKSEMKVTAEEAPTKPKKELISKPLKDIKPVYIHIPLKPPEGQTDEFSYLEFEEKKPQAVPIPEVQIEITEDDNINEKEEDTLNPTPHDESENPVPNNANTSELTVTTNQNDDDDLSAIIFLEGDEDEDNKGEYDIMVVDIDETSHEMKMSQVTNTEVRRQMMESIKKAESQTELAGSKDGSGTNLSRSSSRASKVSKSSIRKRRAKSAEPEKKRKSSVDSSYSRKSLSKIGLLRKLKQFHLPFIKSQSKKSLNTTSSSKEKTPPRVEIPKQHSYSKDQKPEYIHIPLKPPAGQTDEFSHLEFETAPPPRPMNESNETNEVKEEQTSAPEDPQVVASPQFIVLTPPSDDELLDRPDIPETPSSETGSLFHFGELKLAAKNAVEQIHGTLDSVDEESEIKNEVKDVSSEIDKDEKKDTEIEEKVLVDEEDGLKLSQKPVEESKLSLKSNLKAESSPLPKKKVSFKRRKSSQVSKDDGYEEIESPVTTSDSIIKEKSSENPVEDEFDENKQYVPTLNTETSAIHFEKCKPGKSVDEKNKRWSKISDHEYEPINPPPEEKTERSPPKSHVSEVLNPPHHLSDDDVPLDLSVQEMQSDIEARYFNPNNSPTTKVNEQRISPSRKSPPKRSSRSRSKEKEPTKPNKFQTAMKESASKFKTKLQSIKRPNISLPSRPKFQKPNIKRPNIKLPDFSSTFRRAAKPDEKAVTEKPPHGTEKQQSAAEDVNRKGIFDFSTYPRLFKKKRPDYDSGSLKTRRKVNQKEEDSPSSVKVRKETSKDTVTSIRIPLHSEESMDQDNGIIPQVAEELEEEQHPQRYTEDIDTDDEDIRHMERQERHRAAIAAASAPEENRWNSGTFYSIQNGTNNHHYDNEDEDENLDLNKREQEEIITDLDQPETIQQPVIPQRQRGRLQQNDSIDTNQSRDVGSSISSLGQHRTGVLEEIDSDQFFLREKGISQDNIDMGRYLSTEIREAFRMPANALSDMRSYNHEELRASNQSLPETKKKQMKKPRRKKTPHASEERLRYQQESENEDFNFIPPSRPKRKSKRRKKAEPEPEVLPYTETFSVETVEKDVEYGMEEEHRFPLYYENSRMEGKEHPNINVTEPYKDRLHVQEIHDFHRRSSEPIPAAPPRKHKSLKSLNASEHESIFDDYQRNENNNINGYANENAFMASRMQSTAEHFDINEESQQPPKPPSRCRSKTRSMSRTTSHADGESIFDRNESILLDYDDREPIVEEPCIKDLRDAMGYAIVDKNQNKNWEHKFCTVPRSQNKSPERPSRNYSTLVPTRPPRKLSRNMTDEEKENIDISQYIEIEDERDLQSGEVIQKMQNRPLPAPPRPPRARSKPLNDISSEQNIRNSEENEDVNIHLNNFDDDRPIDETEVSTQTEPLPADFVCEEVVQEETDKIMTPSALRRNGGSQEKANEEISEEDPAKVRVETILITPTHYSYQEETITHGQLLVEPLNGAKILPESELSSEKIIQVTREEECTSEIPDTFTKLSDPNELNNPNVKESVPGTPQKTQRKSVPECVDVLKTQKLQVSDLDVDRLTVNELVANKIIVSDIESGNITSHEISSQSGVIKLADLELKPDIVKKLLEQLKESTKEQKSILEEDMPQDDTNSGQKKNSDRF